MTDDGPAWGRGIGVNRDSVVAENTRCQAELKKYDDAVVAQRTTRRDLNSVNSPEAEKAVKATKDKKRIARWEADVKKATEANVKAAETVDQAFKALQKCKGKLTA